MRFTCVITAVALFVVSATSQVNVGPPASINPDMVDITPKVVPVRIGLGARTNGERLAQRLPLLPPQRKSLKPPTPRELAPRTTPSPKYPVITGFIQCRDSTGKILGWVDNTFNNYGEYGLTNVSPSDYGTAKDKRLSCSTAGVSSPDSIRTINGPAGSYDYFGGVFGYASLSSGNFLLENWNYYVLASTQKTPAISVPIFAGNSFTDKTGIPELVQSAIWNINTATRQLTPTLVSSGSQIKSVTPDIEYLPTVDAFALVTDRTTFGLKFGLPSEQVVSEFKLVKNKRQ